MLTLLACKLSRSAKFNPSFVCRSALGSLKFIKLQACFIYAGDHFHSDEFISIRQRGSVKEFGVMNRRVFSFLLQFEPALQMYKIDIYGFRKIWVRRSLRSSDFTKTSATRMVWMEEYLTLLQVYDGKLEELLEFLSGCIGRGMPPFLGGCMFIQLYTREVYLTTVHRNLP